MAGRRCDGRLKIWINLSRTAGQGRMSRRGWCGRRSWVGVGCRLLGKSEASEKGAEGELLMVGKGEVEVIDQIRSEMFRRVAMERQARRRVREGMGRWGPSGKV